MHSILGLGANHVLFAALISWFVAQALKIPIYHHVEHVWDFSRFHGSGGMPSSHSAMVTGTAVMIGDAAGVRRETGTQATVINQILKDMLLNGKKISDEELKELVGHTPLEVAGGALTGLLVAVIYLLILFA